MKSFILGLGLTGSVVALALWGAGCGGKDTGSGGAGGAGGATSSSATTGPVGPGPGSGGNGGSSMGHTFANPFPIAINDMTPAMGTLPDPTSSQDIYKFTGKAGEKIAIATTAKTGTDPFDPTFLDLVVTLYDASQTQIAQQDDPWPRYSNDPQLFTFLPSDGDYYVEVRECNTVFPMSCAPAAMITNNDYTLQVFDFGSTATNSVTDEVMETAGSHADDDVMTPNTLKYVKSSGKYELTFLDGTFVDGADVDVYSFTTPMDATVDMGTRPGADFYIQPAGNNDDGATNPVGLAWIVDSADPTTILAQLDGTKYDDEDDSTNGSADLNVPVTLGHQYFLFVQHPATSHGTNDFYVVEHFVGGGNPVENEFMAAGTNDPTAPEALSMPQMNADGSASYFIEGDVGVGDTDGFAIPRDAFTKVSGICAGLRLGSGATLAYQLNADTNTGALVGNAVTEVANKDVGISAPGMTANIPASATQLVLSITPSAQSATVVGSHYRCGITLSTM